MLIRSTIEPSVASDRETRNIDNQRAYRWRSERQSTERLRL